MAYIGAPPQNRVLSSDDIAQGAVTLNDINFTDQPTNMDITGTIDKHTMRLADGVTITGDVTISDDLVLSKISDDGNAITMTNDGSSRTITGSGSIEASTLSQTPNQSLTGMTGTIGSAVTGGSGLSGMTSLGTVTTGTLGSGVTFPAGMPIQVVSFNTTATGNFDLSLTDTDTDPDIFKLITPRGSGSSFLVSIRWAGEIDIPQDCVFNIQRVVSGASTVRINAPGTLKYQGLYCAGGQGADDDSTPLACGFSTLDTTGSTAGTDITYRLVVSCSSSSTSNSFYTNRVAGASWPAESYETFSSEIIVTEIAG